VAERHFNLRPTPDDPAAIAEALVAARLATDPEPTTACGGESPLLLTLPRHEKAPLLLLVLLWLLCQAANSEINTKMFIQYLHLRKILIFKETRKSRF
jgi:hypothetical protein